MRARLLVKKRFDGDSFRCCLVEQRWREEAGYGGGATGVVNSSHVSPFPERSKIILTLVKRVFRIEGGSHSISDFLRGKLIAIQFAMVLQEDAHDDAIPANTIGVDEIGENR